MVVSSGTSAASTSNRSTPRFAVGAPPEITCLMGGSTLADPIFCCSLMQFGRARHFPHGVPTYSFRIMRVPPLAPQQRGIDRYRSRPWLRGRRAIRHLETPTPIAGCSGNELSLSARPTKRPFCKIASTRSIDCKLAIPPACALKPDKDVLSCSETTLRWRFYASGVFLAPRAWSCGPARAAVAQETCARRKSRRTARLP